MHLPSPYVKDYTNQEHKTFFEMDSSGDLTCRIQHYNSVVAVSFFENLQTERTCQKGMLVATETLSSFVHGL